MDDDINISTSNNEDAESRPTISWLHAIRDQACHSLTMVDGVSNIARSSSRVGAFAWSLILVASSGAFVFLAMRSVGEFTARRVLTTRRLVHEQQQALFPTVTFCPIQWHDMSLGTRDTVDSLLAACSFNNATWTAGDFVDSFWHPVYNVVCFRFNAAQERTKKSLQAGPEFGLRVLLYAKRQRGFFVLVQNASDFAYGATPSPFVVAANSGLNVAVNRSYYSRVYNSDTCRRRTTANYSYTRDTCIELCARRAVTRHCRCQSSSLLMWADDDDEETQVCHSSRDEERACARSFYFEKFVLGGSYAKHCFDKCPIECESHILTFAQSLFDLRPQLDEDDEAYVNKSSQKGRSYFRQLFSKCVRIIQANLEVN